ncbi:DoxX family protein [Chryseobacterium sp. MP_3.2]|uniref:DoxX family protein n=1 Tax=Chryseobacterium sp. MP_3.2 TaxID=3071712 RepID=UPI002DFF38FD|nr:putative membrane protein YphA (DoxX/SURF4 family) [Chryseobacterium sp. MP_3.2]
MNYLLISCVLISSLSFAGYAISYFVSPNMKKEFNRFGLKGFGIYVIVLEILGAAGLLIGLFNKPLLLISAAGLALLMLFGVLTRIKTKDSLLISTPAIFFMILNAFIFYLAITQTV